MLVAALLAAVLVGFTATRASSTDRSAAGSRAAAAPAVTPPAGVVSLQKAFVRVFRQVAPSVVQLGNGCRWCAVTSDGRRHPLTAPSNSAAITCRWNRMNTRSVGSRIRIVPAQRSGMSVA